jgi:hypothetical protein
MLEQIYTSSKTVTAVADKTYYRMCYVKTWDAMMLHYSLAPMKAHKLFRDGTVATMITEMLSLGLQARVGGRHCWMDLTQQGNGEWYAADEISGNFHSSDKLNGAWVPPAEAYKPGSYVDDKHGLILFPYVNRLVKFFNLATGAQTATVTLPGNGNLIYDHLAWAGEGMVIAIEFGTGRVAMLDYLNLTVLWTSVIRPCIMAAYDCLHRLIVTVENDLLVRLFTLDPVPAALASPVFVPAANQHRLMGSRVQTRLTGDDGEPCGNYWIHWNLLGSPKGELLKDKSKTDANGYAENYYFGPPPSGAIGEETILVSVKVPA